MGKETAEQKLLKLIEKTDAQENTDAAQPKASANDEALRVYDSVRGVGQAGLSVPPVLSQILSTLKRIVSGEGPSRTFGLREINKILALCLIVVAIFFSVDFTKGIKRVEEESGLALKEKSGGLKEAIQDLSSLLPSFKDFKEYAKVVKRRNIFQPFERKIAEDDSRKLEEELGISHVSERTKDLKLVGISWLDTPESASAMVENTISGVTYFLKQGDKINEVIIEGIYAESIIVSYAGEAMEMKL